MSTRKGIFLTVASLVFLLLLIVLRGCSGRVIPGRVIYFKDANSNQIVTSVLVIPRYYAFWGVSVLHGDGNVYEGYVLANPFVYTSDGSLFKVKQPRAHGLLILPYFIGKSMGVTGVIVIAKGYEPTFINSDNLWRGNINSSLKPLNEKEAKGQLQRISNGLRNKEFEVLLPSKISLPSASESPVDYNFKANFRKKDVKTINAFFGIDTKTK